MSIRPVGELPVLLAAMRRGCHLAGAVADGTVLWMTGPRTIAEHVLPRLTDAAAEAGRPAPRVVCVLPICVTDDEAAARALAAKVFAVYDPSLVQGDARPGRRRRPGERAIVGEEAAVRQQVQALADIGVTDFAAGEFVMGDDALRTRALLRDSAIGGR